MLTVTAIMALCQYPTSAVWVNTRKWCIKYYSSCFLRKSEADKNTLVIPSSVIRSGPVFSDPTKEHEIANNPIVYDESDERMLLECMEERK